MDKELLKYRIKAAGKTYDDIAEELGVSSRTVQAKVNGKRDFTLTEIKGIAKSLNICSDEFMRIFFNRDVE